MDEYSLQRHEVHVGRRIQKKEERIDLKEIPRPH